MHTAPKTYSEAAKLRELHTNEKYNTGSGHATRRERKKNLLNSRWFASPLAGLATTPPKHKKYLLGTKEYPLIRPKALPWLCLPSQSPRKGKSTIDTTGSSSDTSITVPGHSARSRVCWRRPSQPNTSSETHRNDSLLSFMILLWTYNDPEFYLYRYYLTF